jgi:CBS domain-containing protein
MKALDVLDSKTARVRHVLEDEAEGSFIGFESPIHEAVALIATRPNSALAVMDGQGDLVGILTETDIIRGLQNLGPVILNETVASIMTKDPVIARSEDSCRDRLVAMIEGNFRNMPVYDGKKFIGILRTLEAAEGKLSELISENRKLTTLITRLVPDEFYFPPAATIDEIQTCLDANDLPCVPIKEDDRILGIIADSDVCKAQVSEVSGTQN